MLQDIQYANNFDTNVDRVTFADTTTDKINGNEIWINPRGTFYTWQTNCVFVTGKGGDDNWQISLHLFKRIETDIKSSGEALLEMEIFSSDVKRQMILNKDLQNISGFSSLRLHGEIDYPVIAGETNIIEKELLIDIKFTFDENNI
jgi:hypothetical protein